MRDMAVAAMAAVVMEAVVMEAVVTTEAEGTMAEAIIMAAGTITAITTIMAPTTMVTTIITAMGRNNVWIGPGVYYGYDSGDGCDYAYQRWMETGSSYWRQRYYDCSGH